MSKYPLDIPAIMKRIRPHSNYKLKDRTYEGIVWLDRKREKPTLQELEDDFLRHHHDIMDKVSFLSALKKKVGLRG